MNATENFFRTHITKWVNPDEEEWEAFFSRFKARSLKKNEMYVSAGGLCRHMAFVVKGALRMYYTIEGEERCKDFQVEGQFTGSLYSFLSGQPSRFSVTSLENCELLEISRPDLLALYDQYRVWEHFGRLYMEQMFFYKEAREAALLFDSSKLRYENLLRDQAYLLQRIPQKYLASYLGIRPESLSRIRRKIGDHLS